MPQKVGERHISIKIAPETDQTDIYDRWSRSAAYTVGMKEVSVWCAGTHNVAPAQVGV